MSDKVLSLQEVAKERTVKTTSVDYDLETLSKKIRRGSIILDPDYQRNHKWDVETSSRLIESLILNIPIPLIYISQDVDVDVESDEPMYSVIDGQQRLRAIYDFMQNKYALKGLETLKDINGLKYKDLPPFLIRRLEDRTVRCLRIDSSSDSQVKLDIFERLNSGSVKLTAQELRNATMRGRFNDLIKDLAKDRFFIQMINDPKESKRVKGMYNYELVLRFLALEGGKYQEYDGKMGNYLDIRMAEFSKISDQNILDEMKTKFKKTMKICFSAFGVNAFSKRKDGKIVSPFNVAVYDALSLAVSENSLSNIDESGREKFESLFSSEEFQNSISGSINDKSKIVYRIKAMMEAFK
ncbi:DUF262 domain-containing protein [Deinococcus sp. LM3]|uniref:DUF262 domain-containing protein n=1 Tax=Deinococcus sp. LM3 TaxID=1938608 RepID=UPI0009932ED3|nr:DUF262 domain-containing protein [Deinococcus sp. LM3]OOV14606.1 hypothetical protein BXU09_07945 [Deinococcus sp. LM3]